MGELEANAGAVDLDLTEDAGVPIDSQESFEYSPTSLDSFELDIADITKQEGFVYPALLLRDVLFMDCLRVLKSRKQKSYREVDAWVSVESNGTEEFTKIGTLQLDSNTLLVLRHLRIGATLYAQPKVIVDIDLDDPETLEKYV